MSSVVRASIVAAVLLAFQAGVGAQATVATPRTPGEPMFSVSEEEEDRPHTSLVCQSYTREGSVEFRDGKARSDIVVQDHFRVDDVRVSGITMKHPRVGVLQVNLRGVSLGPRGLDSLHEKSVTLVNRKGKHGQNYLFTGFSDQASSPFPDAKRRGSLHGPVDPGPPLRMMTRGPGVKAANGGRDPATGSPGRGLAHFDADNDGHLSMDEYQAALDELKRLNLPEEDLIDMFGELDRNNNDLLSLDDFLQHHSEKTSTR
eukprot:jgi/Pico_ML_1/55812/g1448.t1